MRSFSICIENELPNVSLHDDIIKWKHFRVTGLLCGEFTGHGEFSSQRPVMRSFDVFFDLRLNEGFSKQCSKQCMRETYILRTIGVSSRVYIKCKCHRNARSCTFIKWLSAISNPEFIPCENCVFDDLSCWKVPHSTHEKLDVKFCGRLNIIIFLWGPLKENNFVRYGFSLGIKSINTYQTIVSEFHEYLLLTHK